MKKKINFEGLFALCISKAARLGPGSQSAVSGSKFTKMVLSTSTGWPL
jgi:hypothetical protein